MYYFELPFALDTELCLLGNNVFSELPACINKYWQGKQVLIIADENTWLAAGEKVHSVLSAAEFDLAEPFIFPGKPTLHADYEHVKELVPLLKDKAVIAVGAGTINDLVKRASFEASTSYLCFATAASVDGYTSAGAAIMLNGVKGTMECPAPIAIIADNEVIANAPFEMTAAGYGDLAAKLTAGADWHLAAALGEHPYNEKAWELVQKDLRLWLQNPEKLKDGDPLAMQYLFTGLANTGFAMQLMKDSRPASGTEHLFSHVWEMRGITHNGEEPSHGFKVAIGTLLTTALMETAFSYSAEEIEKLSNEQKIITKTEREKEIKELLQGTTFLENALKVALEKFLSGEKLQERRREIFAKWDFLAEKLSQQLLPYEELQANFATVSCPVEPLSIGISKESLIDAVRAAVMIRHRYTILDLLFELGILEYILQEVLQKEYFFN